MATPTFVSAGTASVANGTAPTVNLPASLANGDVLVMFSYSRCTTSGTDISASAGWDLRVTHGPTATGIIKCWTRTYKTGDTAGSLSLSGSWDTDVLTGDTIAVQVAAFRTTHQSSPMYASIAAVASTSSVDMIAGSPGGNGIPNQHLEILMAGRRANCSAIATLSGDLTWTEIGEVRSGLGGDMSMAWDYAPNETGSTVTVSQKTFTVSGSGATATKGIGIVLRPEQYSLGSMTYSGSAAPDLTVEVFGDASGQFVYDAYGQGAFVGRRRNAIVI